MTEPVANEAAAALSAGARLAQARERLGMSQEQVADKLKLDTHTVAALEIGDYRVIGAAVFVRGFLRRYAQLVGDSPLEIEALYARQPESSLAPDLARVAVHAQLGQRPRRSIGWWPVTLAVVALVVAGIWWWASHRTPAPRGDSTTELSGTSAPGGAAAPGTSGSLIAAAGASVPAPARSATASAPAEATSAAAAEAAALAARLAAQPRRHLALRVNDESWVEAYDARGARLQFGFAHAGTTLELIGTPPYRLVLGNAGAVEVSVEGAPVSLPVATAGARLRVTVSGKGVVTLRP